MSNDELRQRVSHITDNISSLRGGADEQSTKNEHNYDQINKEGELLMKAQGIKTPDEYRQKLLAILPEEHRKQLTDTLAHLQELGQEGAKISSALTYGLGVAASGKVFTLVGKKLMENFGSGVARAMIMKGFKLMVNGQKELGLKCIKNAGKVGRLYLKEAETGERASKLLRSLEKAEGFFTKVAKWLFVVDIVVMILEIHQNNEEHTKLIDAIQELVPSRFQSEEMLMEFRATASLWDDIRKHTTETEVEETDDKDEEKTYSEADKKVLKDSEERKKVKTVQKYITQYEENMAKITDDAVWTQLEAYDQDGGYRGADPSKDQVKVILGNWAKEAQVQTT